MKSTIDEEIEEILEHYGTRGMKWGVRAKAAVNTRPGQPQPIAIGERAGKPLVTAGGRGHPAVDEAKRAAGLRQLAKKSGVQALTNKELKELNERINLEQNYSKLTSADNQAKLGRGKKFTTSLMKTTGGIARTQLTKAANDVASKKIADMLGTRTAAGAAAAAAAAKKAAGG